eukprot:3317695-Rhodomonas_salina.3
MSSRHSSVVKALSPCVLVQAPKSDWQTRGNIFPEQTRPILRHLVVKLGQRNSPSPFEPSDGPCREYECLTSPA